MSLLMKGERIAPSLVWPLSKFTTHTVIKGEFPFAARTPQVYPVPNTCASGNLADDLSQMA